MDTLSPSLAAVLIGYAASLTVLARADSAGRLLIRSAEAFVDAGPVVGLVLVLAMAAREAPRPVEEPAAVSRSVPSTDVAAAPSRSGRCLPAQPCPPRRG